MWLGAELEDGLVDHLRSGVGDEAQAALGEDLESEVAAAFGPFVGLFREDRSDESDDRVAVREDADTVGAAADFAVEALVRIVRPDLLPEPLGEPGEREDVGPGVIKMVVRVGSF